jgi:hypothetical protein
MYSIENIENELNECKRIKKKKFPFPNNKKNRTRRENVGIE